MNVGGFDIAVHDAAFVCVADRLGNLRQQLQSVADWQRVGKLEQADAVDKLHGQERHCRLPIGDTRLEDLGDARMLQAAKCLRFATEPLQAVRREPIGPDALQRDAAAGFLLLGLEDDAHATFADLADHAIAAGSPGCGDRRTRHRASRRSPAIGREQAFDLTAQFRVTTTFGIEQALLRGRLKVRRPLEDRSQPRRARFAHGWGSWLPPSSLASIARAKRQRRSIVRSLQPRSAAMSALVWPPKTAQHDVGFVGVIALQSFERRIEAQQVRDWQRGFDFDGNRIHIFCRLPSPALLRQPRAQSIDEHVLHGARRSTKNAPRSANVPSSRSLTQASCTSAVACTDRGPAALRSFAAAKARNSPCRRVVSAAAWIGRGGVSAMRAEILGRRAAGDKPGARVPRVP